MKIHTRLWIEIGHSEKRKHKTGIADQSVPRAKRKITIGVQERKRTPSVYTMAAFSFVCRSTPKLLCQLSETCRHYRVLHNLGCLKDVDRWQNFNFMSCHSLSCGPPRNYTLLQNPYEISIKTKGFLGVFIYTVVFPPRGYAISIE